jgi:hypothetical protein
MPRQSLSGHNKIQRFARQSTEQSMPIFLVSLVIQIALVVHVLKTGRNMMWVFILLFAPLIGTIAYLIVEVMPEWSNSRGARHVRRNVGRVINPNRNLNSATDRFAVADTAANAIGLAEELLQRERYSEAKELYQGALKGVHSDDPVLLLGLAKSQFGLREFEAVVKTLTELREKNPSFSSPEGHLLFARAKEELDAKSAAMEEYAALAKYYPGPEPLCRLALLYKKTGDAEKARELFTRVMSESRIAGRHYNTLHKEWVSMAKKEVAG